MSSIITDQGSLHYEVYGKGKPVILLHGWLGSWGLWQDTMTYLGKYYRTYALDFWGFGESGTQRSTYQVVDFVSLVDQFMEQMGIVSAPLVGHSMGGTVSLSVALKFPHRVQKVVVIGSPIKGSSLAPGLKLAGKGWIASLIFNHMGLFRYGLKLVSPYICRDPDFPDMIDNDLSKTTLESFLTSIASLRNTDLRPRLHEIGQPVMGIYGAKDIIVDPNEWRTLSKGKPTARIERYINAGHFAMLEEPESVREKLKNFLDNNTSNL
ncbi:MAG: alpha/beta hydrolase [Anaerolineae bacterium]|nr:alpha/beta hydrolase [Anaerolineae bacterium]